MRIALDALGGDHAPQPNIDGALKAVSEHPDLHISLVGTRDEIDPLFDQAGGHERIEVVDCNGGVGMDEKPTDAIKNRPDCSLGVCWKLMAEKSVDAVVSAGNTGAVVAFGLKTRLYLKGVKRPGIAVPLPSREGQIVLMDGGANPGARAEHLVQYAAMGRIYARDVLGIAHPKIGLLNIGSEKGKGIPLCQETHALIEASPLNEHYIGNVEGRDLYAGTADVVLCEGFVGNTVLKASEGLADLLFGTVAGSFRKAFGDDDRPMATLKEAAKAFQYQESGGAPLLGVDGICMICHGSSDARAIANAIRAAIRAKEQEINRKISHEIHAG